MRSLKHLIWLLLFASSLSAQTVQVPYQGSAPYSGNVSVQIQITGLPSGCVVGTPVYSNGVIITPVTNCGSTPPPPVTNCSSASVPLQGCGIGSTVAVVNQPGNVRGTPAAGGGNGPLMGTQNAGATGTVMSNPQPQASPSTAGWQLINFGAASCTTAGPFSAACGYVGNDNLKPTTTPPPTAPKVSCAPSSVQTGASSTCSGNQAITSWKASAGTISSAGVFTAPSTAQTVTVTGTNANGSGTTPITVTSVVTKCTILSPSGGQDNAALLAAINSSGGGCVELRLGTYNLSPITLPSGTSLVLDDAVVIQDFGIFGRTTVLFNVSNKMSIVGAGPLFSAVVKMPTNYANAIKQVANGQDYEYQHCFALVNGVSGVVLSNFSLLNCAGDGLNFNNTTGATITNLNSATNIRQGYSITGPATNWTITGGNLHDGPLSGFDLEPDSGITGNIQGTITNLQTNNNVGGGTSFGFMNLTSSSNINIVDNNPTSTNDGGTAFAFWNGSNNVAPTGSVTVNNGKSTGSGADCSYGQRSNVGYTITFNNLTCINSNSKQSSGPNQTNTALGLACNSCTGGAVPGGVQWLNTTITGGHGSFSIPSNAAGVKITGTYNGGNISYP